MNFFSILSNLKTLKKTLTLSFILLSVFTSTISSQTVWTVDKTIDDVTMAGTLRHSIINAATDDTIKFSASINAMAIVLASDLDIFTGKSLAIIGNGMGITIIDGDPTVSTFRLLDIRAGSDTYIEGITFQNGGSPTGTWGGAIITQSKLTLESCEFKGNEAIRGGALYSRIEGSFNIQRCIFSNNSSNQYGGAIATNNSGDNRIENSLLYGNNATTNGGAISIQVGTWDIFNCTMAQDTAGIDMVSSGLGGAIYANNPGSIDSFYNNIFAENICYSTGGQDVDISISPVSAFNNYLGDFTNSKITNGSNGNIGGGTPATPGFVDAPNDNFHLQHTSPCKNQGIEYGGISSIDLDGKLRISESLVDVGAYEQGACAYRVYVDLNASGSSPDGLSWATAFTELQDGINKAMTGGCEVWVASGTYYPTVEFDTDGLGGSDVREKTFYINKDIQIYGGFAGGETMLSDRDLENNPTILSGDIDNTPGDSTGNAYHVMYIDGTTTNGHITNACVIDGFTFEKGNADDAMFPNNSGGGIYNNGTGTDHQSSPTISNCLFNNNHATNGGAITNNASEGLSIPSFTNCTFTNNDATSGGAGYNIGIDGVCSPNFTNCSFANNIASSEGGAIRNFDTNDVRIENCIFWNNGDEIADNGANGTTLNYSLFDDGTIDEMVTPPTNITGANNIDANPLFVDAANGDLRLQENSPAKNVGNNAAAGLSGVTTDLDGNLRIIEETVDMGAYENRCLSTGSVIYVNHTVSDGDGTSWTSAFSDLQDAIDFACECSQTEIWVAQGTYFPTIEFDGDNSGGSNVREKTFYINKDIQIYGGFSGSETMLSDRDWKSNVTILSGDIGNLNDNSDNAYHVVVMDGTTGTTITNVAILDGFQITDGNGNGGSQNNRGGAIYNSGDGTGNESSPSISNCSFYNNSATFLGGGAIYNGGAFSGASSPSLSNCSFYNNSATLGGALGGAIYNNGDSSGASSPSLSNCSFYNNSATFGGAIYNDGEGSGTSNPQITNCSFSNNNASELGGAIYNTGFSSGTSNPQITNCSFSNNNASDNGGAIYNTGSSSGTCNPQITNCSFYNNSANLGGAIRNFSTTNVAIENCIFWNNGDEIADNDPNGTTLNYSLLDDGNINGEVTLPANITGANNIDANPLFVDAANGDLRLQNSSPAINLGNNNASGLSGITTDLDGNPRFELFVDMGAYEVQTFTGTDMDMDGLADDFDNCANNITTGLDFDGSNDYIDIPHHSSLNISSTVTVEAWINARTWKTNVWQGTIVGKDDYSSSISKGFVLRCGNDGQLSFAIGTGDSSNEWPEVQSSQNAMSLNTWHHVAGTLAGNTLTIYIDGIEAGSATFTPNQFTNSEESLYIGESPSFSGRHFDGKIDEVKIWNTARTVQEIRGNMLKELKGDESDLLAYYKFNEGIPNGDNTALMTVLDETVNNNDGTPTNFAKNGMNSNWVEGAPVNFYDSDNDGAGDPCDACPGFDDRLDGDMDFVADDCDNCPIATSLKFDGVDDYIALPNESSFDFTTSMTVEAWIKVSTFDKRWQTIIAKGDNSWRLTRNDLSNNIHFAASGTDTWVNGTIDVADGEWHHVAGVFDGSSKKIYIDGMLDGSITSSGSINNSDQPVWIGDNPQINVSRHFNGNIDEVRIWNVARTQSQIQGNLNNEIDPSTTGLVAYYKFKEGLADEDNTALAPFSYDEKGNHPGTLVNFSQNGNTSNWSESPVAGNPDQTDTDGDGIGDPCERCPGFDDNLDYNLDGIPDACDPPINDDCSNAIPLTIYPYGACPSNNTSGITHGAHVDIISSSGCGAPNFHGVWYSFTTGANQTSVKVYFENMSGDHAYYVYGDCGSTDIFCTTDHTNVPLIDALTVSTTYYVYVYHENNSGEFSICISDPDECPPFQDLSGDITGSGTYNSENDMDSGLAESGKIISVQAIKANANINYNAGKEVILNQGFEVEANAVFHAYIHGCPILPPAPLQSSEDRMQKAIKDEEVLEKEQLERKRK